MNVLGHCYADATNSMASRDIVVTPWFWGLAHEMLHRSEQDRGRWWQSMWHQGPYEELELRWELVSE
jgi:hypothetical protein